MKKKNITGTFGQFFLTGMFSIIYLSILAQNAPITMLASISNASPGQQVTIPVTVTGFTTITSITLNIDYDNTKLQFVNSVEFLPGTASIGDAAIANGFHRLTISWISSTGNGVNLSDGFSIANFGFNYISGIAALTWYDDGESCSYTGDLGSVLNDTPTSTYYINGSVSGSAPTTKVLNIKAFLEGPYSAGTMSTALNLALIPHTQPYNVSPWNYSGTENVTSIPADVVDWVLVELRDAATPATATPATRLSGWPKAMFLKKDGSIVALDGVSPPDIGNPTVSNNLYAVIRHRNHIAVMSATGLTLTGNTYSYDFSTAVTQAYGGAAGYKQIGTGGFGMVAGDIDSDGSLYNSDFLQWRINSGTINAYNNSDLDFDNSVYNSDFTLWRINSGVTNPITKSAINIKSEVVVEPKYSSQVPK